MSSFTSPLIVRKVTGRTWELEKGFTYHVGSEDSDEVVEVPAGFLTDFASVPRLLWWLIPPDGSYSQSAVLHDYLYYTKQYSRSKADKIFYEAMGVLGVSNWKRSIMHFAVRVAGWIPWKKRKPFVSAHNFILLLILLCLSGCASTSLTYDDKDRLVKIQGWGLQETELKKDGAIKHKMALSWWPKDLVNIVFGAKN